MVSRRQTTTVQLFFIKWRLRTTGEYPELSRAFNGILASLETHEWSIIQLFERLSYSHYKEGNISAMVRTKLRVRFEDLILSDKLSRSMESDETFKKEFFKLDRSNVINFLLRNKITFPPNLENIIYLVNYFFIKNETGKNITPKILIDNFIQMEKSGN